MDSRKIRTLYGQMVEFRETLRSLEERNVEKTYSDSLILTLGYLVDADISEVDYLISLEGIAPTDPDFPYVSRSVLQLAVGQAIAILEYGYGLKDQVVELGSLYNSIKDSQLRDRCADLLTSDSNFDRVISTATTVLEDRIRKRVGGSQLTGTQLVNSFIKGDPENSPIVFSTDKSEQEGYSNLVRGIFLALRNGTHHQVSDDFSREDAFAACAFIDRLLRKLDAAPYRGTA